MEDCCGNAMYAWMVPVMNCRGFFHQLGAREQSLSASMLSFSLVKVAERFTPASGSLETTCSRSHFMTDHFITVLCPALHRKTNKGQDPATNY